MKKIRTYHLAAFLGAFLLFQIQPMMSKALLPTFGGSYLVWGACMVFFQAVLLLGYAYAHFVQRWVGVVRYSRWHLGVLALAFLCVSASLGAAAAGDMAGGLPLSIAVFLILLRVIGLPFLALSTTSLILQEWLAASDCPQRDNPYVLYSASNLGSMLGLLTYPVFVEPFLGLRAQVWAWWGGYACFVVLHAVCLPRRTAPAARGGRRPNAPRPAWRQTMTWFLPSVAGCAALVAVTNVMTLDIAPVPLLWVLPLSVYLLSFVVAFKQRMWYPAWSAAALPWALTVGMLLYLMAQLHLVLPVGFSVVLHLALLFIICLNCSARLAMARPEEPARLTLFYLVLAFGGLVGSGLVVWVFPYVSASLLEYPVSLVLVAASMAVAGKWPPCAGAGEAGRSEAPAAPGVREAGRPILIETAVCVVISVVALTAVPLALFHFLGAGARRESIVLAAAAVPMVICLLRLAGRPWPMTALLLGVAVAMNWTEDLAMGARKVRRVRNFYGIYRVFDRDDVRYLQHGSTLHGRQYRSGPKMNTPLAYYHPTTPAAGILQSDALGFDRIDMIGLGTGALAAYARAGQRWTIRELDPDNLPIAMIDFTYLDAARRHGAKVSFVEGDGRVTLRQAPARSVDLLIIDAFNSDSIPVHLLTVEAFQEYFRALTPDGILLLHVSNKFLRLASVIYSNARRLGIPVCEKSNEGTIDPDADPTYWMALSKSARRVEALKSALGWRQAAPPDLPEPWTDQYSNIMGAMLLK